MTTNHEHLREMAEKATPGPWIHTGYGSIQPASGGTLVASTVGNSGGWRCYLENATFIATFNPTTAIAMLDELAALRKENEALRRAVFNKDLYAVLMDVQNHIDSPALPAMANRSVIKIDAARAAIGDSHE